MKRASLCALLLLAASVNAAQEKWWDAYKRGVEAVNSKNYRGAAEALQIAVAQNPTEGTAVRTPRETITYVPHFWLGIAKFNLGDTEGALREWRTSEEQGVLARTEYYARLKDWVARAQTEKQREAQAAASAPRKAADTAISRALAAQMDAVSAGADRSEGYRTAQRKLQEALGIFNKAGSDIAAYRSVEQNAQQASSLFAAAADSAKKEKAARAANVKPPAPANRIVPPPPKAVPKLEPQPVPAEAKVEAKVEARAPAKVPVQVVVPQQAVVESRPAPPVQTQTAQAVPVESEVGVSARIALQEYRRRVNDLRAQRGSSDELRGVLATEAREVELLRKKLDNAKGDEEFGRIARTADERSAAIQKRVAGLIRPAVVAAAVMPPSALPAGNLQSAWRAFASGNFDSSEQILSTLVGARGQVAEAYLLRGCTRYTKAMLSRNPDPLLAAATDDFKAALERDRKLRLDPKEFSPKLVAFFDQLRAAR